MSHEEEDEDAIEAVVEVVVAESITTLRKTQIHMDQAPLTRARSSVTDVKNMAIMPQNVRIQGKKEATKTT